ncbi:MAG: glutamate synthase [Legionellales bacterium]|nr:glutamate synthase [Legionellales bacterium]
MHKPFIAGVKSKVVELKPDETYYFCVCGLSNNQPFCDGSHRGTDFKPQKFTVSEAKQVHLCMCKRTGNAPFCDGTHRQLSETEIEQYQVERT